MRPHLRLHASSSSPAVRRLALALVLAASLALVMAASARGSHEPQVGSYSGAANPAGVAAFGDWLGRTPTYALDYLPMSDDWAEISDARWLMEAWQHAPYTLILSLPILTSSGASLAEGAAGAYDHHFVRLAENLVSHGLGDTVLRPGWEFNHEFFPWFAHDPHAFAAYWRRIVDAMRSVPGGAFRFDWSPNLGGTVDLAAAYPGDRYVDVISLDVYNQSWLPGWEDPVTRWQQLVDQPYGLAWHRDFARARGKPIGFPEWGMITRADGHGGGDDPYYIERMYEWMIANRAVYSVYFDFDTHESSSRMSGGALPQGGARFRALFGTTTPEPPSAPPPGMRQPSSPARSPLVPPREVWVERLATRTLDRARPTVEAIARLRGPLLTVWGTARDAGRIRRVVVRVDRRVICRVLRARFRCRSGRVPSGWHLLRVTATDRAGNRMTVRRVVRLAAAKRQMVRLRPSKSRS